MLNHHHSTFDGHVDDDNSMHMPVIDFATLVHDDHYRDNMQTDMLRHQRQQHDSTTTPSLPWPSLDGLDGSVLQPACLPLCVVDDDDCASDCSTECDGPCASQCGDVVCCDDDACKDPQLCRDDTCESPELCRDEACQGRPCMDENCLTDCDKAAAAALTSFGDNNQLPMMQFNDQSLMPCASFSTFFTLPDGSSCFPNQPCNITMQHALANHIVQYHDPSLGLPHANKCVANDPAQLISRCTLPKIFDNTYMSSLPPPSECGFQVQDPNAFVNHILEDHRPMLGYHQAGHGPYAANNSSPIACQHPPPYMAHHDQRFSPSPPPPPPPLTSLSVGPSLSATPSSLASFTAPSPLESVGTRSLSPPGVRSLGLAPEDQFTCRWIAQHGDICGRRFDNDENLQNHCKLDHLKQLKKARVGFKCGWASCTRTTSFTQRSKLERHMQVHTGYKPVHCDVCGAALSAKQALEQHKRIHTGETPWVCRFDDCDCAFKQQSALTMHERTHTGVKPLSCEICHKRFSESSNLSKHRRTHNVKGVHECQICGKDFHRLDQLRRHVSTNHKDRQADLDDLFGKAKPRFQPTLKVTKHLKTTTGIPKTVLQHLDAGVPRGYESQLL